MSQSFSDFEIIAVDDGSKDRSRELVESYRDPRVRLIVHDTNRGMTAARHSAASSARGVWFVNLDSDNELAAGALDNLAGVTGRQGAAQQMALGACFKDDNGELLPKPIPKGRLDVAAYLRWIEMARITDYLNVIHRDVYAVVQWPTDRRKSTQFHLRKVRHFGLEILPLVAAFKHYDAPNRNAKNRRNVNFPGYREYLGDVAIEKAEILSEFGPLMAVHAPAFYSATLSACAMFRLEAGNRRQGLATAVRYLWKRPLSRRMWTIIVLGVLGPKYLHWGRDKWGKRL